MATTLAAWMVAFLIVWAQLIVLGDRLESLPYVLNALVFTGVLVPVMGNLVMPVLSSAITGWMGSPTLAREPGTRPSPSTARPAPPRTGQHSAPADPPPTAALAAPTPGIALVERCRGGGGFELRPIAWVESPLISRGTAPKRGDEGSPDAWLVFQPALREGLRDLLHGTGIIVLTWLDPALRDVLVTHPPR